ncbi:MAG: hypothetical protein ACI86H_002104 [bacterium]|jgi:hypothetical protein
MMKKMKTKLPSVKIPENFSLQFKKIGQQYAENLRRISNAASKVKYKAPKKGK